MSGCQDVRMSGCQDVKMSRCQDVKMSGWMSGYQVVRLSVDLELMDFLINCDGGTDGRG